MTLAELQAELIEINAAISAIRKGGQSYTINSGNGGTSRTITQADYNALIKDRDNIRIQIDSLSSKRATILRPGW